MPCTMDTHMLIPKHTQLALFALIAVVLLSGCSAMKRADKKFERGEYNVALDLYEKAAKKNKYAGEANFQIGECYRLSNRIREAKPFYQEAIENGYSDEAAQFYLAFSMKANAEYDAAQQKLDEYLEAATNFEYIEYARKEFDNLSEINRLLNEESYYRVKNLEDLNTPEDEYSPVYNDGDLYFTSSRNSTITFEGTGGKTTDIFKVKVNGARPDMATLEMLDDVINDPNVLEGSVTFSPDGTTMIYSKGNTGRRRGMENVNLYEIRYTRRGDWTEPRLIRASDPESWDSCPSFSSDGRTLYFASDRDGGYGGLDIYSATRDGRGRWGNVRNMGNTINTPGNEAFPYASPDGKLYFSSDGHPSLGGLDLFVATRQGGKTTIENLGVPMNSSADDFALFLFDPSKGFFSSNREGGAGSDDIYTFVNNDPDLKIVNYYLAGKVYEPVENEEGEQVDRKILGNVHVKLVGADGTILEEAYTGDNGAFQFRVYPEEDYTLIADKDNYFTTRSDFSTVGRSVDKSTLTQLVTNRTFNTDMMLDPIVLDKAIVLENIYYEFNSDAIVPEAAEELDKLVEILNDNPQIRIELSSHTDSVGSNAYNLELSQRRAKSAVNYIIEHGIDESRIVSRGYGENQPIARNTNPDGTDNPEGRAKNRRTEFKVIEITKRATPDGQEGDYFEEDQYFNGG